MSLEAKTEYLPYVAEVESIFVYLPGGPLPKGVSGGSTGHCCLTRALSYEDGCPQVNFTRMVLEAQDTERLTTIMV